eukprot:maker-scaffold886_size84816-snap-gene-0.28 protein:Tk01968 transcript:maker-scaffold886_size84816-snap-gene-0.28-mRNA-1 annotation:"signal recognition particle 68 kda protein"
MEKGQPNEAHQVVEDMDEDVPAMSVEGEDDGADEVFHLKILPLTHDLHQKHGLRHNDYQRYRGYCARRIARVRKALKLVQGEKRKYTRKEVTLDVLKDPKVLQIPLMTVERAWSYAMQLKFEMNSEPRKKYHMINRLRKAEQESAKLQSLVMDAEKCDARAKLEVQAYHAWIQGTYFFERQDWRRAMEVLTLARAIYEKLSLTLSEDEAELYKQRMAEIVPSLRFCAYNSGDEIAKQDLIKMRGGAHGGNVEELINQAREEQAATLQEVNWRGRKMAVKHEKVRLFLLREQEFEEEISSRPQDHPNGPDGELEAQVEAFESLLMDCKDAIQVLRDELLEDPNFRNRQQVQEGAVSSNHFLYTYLIFIKLTRTNERNLVMIKRMNSILEGKETNSKRPVKPQDLIRLYESVIQNLGEIPLLAGLEDDLSLKHEIEAKTVFYKALRCYFIALTFLMAEKWPEAMALFQRATQHAQKAKIEENLNSSLRSEAVLLVQAIESRQFMAHAKSILEAEGVSDDTGKTQLPEKSPLFERLDTYVEDPELLKGTPNLVGSFPPNFQPIPCKPLFFDLAREQVAFPSLENRLATVPDGQKAGGASGGWLGGWLGGWGGKK